MHLLPVVAALAGAAAQWHASAAAAAEPSHWEAALCEYTGAVVLGQVTSTAVVEVEGYPVTRAEVDIIWTDKPGAFLSTHTTFDQFGGCFGSHCYANNAIHQVREGEVWILAIASTGAASSPLALGKNGMFRVEPSLEAPTTLESGCSVTTVTGRRLAMTPAGVEVAASGGDGDVPQSALAIAQWIANRCASAQAQP